MPADDITPAALMLPLIFRYFFYSRLMIVAMLCFFDALRVATPLREQVLMRHAAVTMRTRLCYERRRHAFRCYLIAPPPLMRQRARLCAARHAMRRSMLLMP